MTDLQKFEFEGAMVRTVLVDGEPWFVAKDVAAVLGYREAKDLTRNLDEDEKGRHEMPTLGGNQTVSVLSEAGLFKALVQRQTGRMVDGSTRAQVKAFQRWVTHDVLPAIRRTGSYAVDPAPALTDDEIVHQALQITAAKVRALESKVVETEARAEVAEDRIDTIEGGTGFSIREFHKHYFSDVPERQLFELLYRKKLLIDQRGQRTDKHGNTKPGKQHMHPGAAGKPYFFLHPYIDKYTGDRHYNTKVRPGTPETNLVAQLERWGLASNKNQRPLFQEITR